MIEWWTSLPVPLADSIVIVTGMGVLGLYAMISIWYEDRQK